MKFSYSEIVSKSTKLFVPSEIYTLIYKKVYTQEVLPELKNLQCRFKLKDEPTKNALHMLFWNEFYNYHPWRVMNYGRSVELVNRPFGPVTRWKNYLIEDDNGPNWWKDGVSIPAWPADCSDCSDDED